MPLARRRSSRRYSSLMKVGRRYTAARRIQRAYRSRKSKRRSGVAKRRRPTVRKNAYAIRQLYKMNDPKFQYAQLANVNVNSSLTWTELPLNAIQFNLPAPTVPPAPGQMVQWMCREKDSVQVRLKNIRIHFFLSASPGRSSGRNQRYYVALVKTTNGIGSLSGITMPTPAEVFDTASIDTTAGSLLAPWEGFRLTQGPDSETLKSTTILKSWTGYLCPQGGDCQQNYSTVTAPVPGTDQSSTNAVAAGLNVNYTQDRPSQIHVKYTHKCLNALTTFGASTDSEPLNVKYFLVALGMNSDLGQWYNINATCKINYIDN